VLAARLDEALIGELRTEALALLNTRIAGASVYHGSLGDRLTSPPPLAREDRDVAAAWGDYATRLADDPDAEL
jgi:hypothetical protein